MPNRTRLSLDRYRDRGIAPSFWVGCIAALGLILLASFVRANEPLSYSGSVEPCLSPHGDRDLYRQGLAGVGWTDVNDEGRIIALEMLADVYLPITGGVDGTWADFMAHRPDARAFWQDLSRNRTIMTREGQVLLLAGFLNPEGKMLVECWVAGPANPTTSNLIALIGSSYTTQGLEMAQVSIPADDDSPLTEIFVSRMSPPTPVEPPLAATDGLRTRITFIQGDIGL